MKIDLNAESPESAGPVKALTKVLVQNEHVKDLVEECAEELSSVNTALEQEIEDGSPQPAVEAALDKTRGC